MTRPARVWWHAPCGAEEASEAKPTVCRCGADDPVWEPLGWRVGYNGATYSYYSTLEGAMRDKRVKMS